jgi:hypothetical protein
MHIEWNGVIISKWFQGFSFPNSADAGSLASASFLLGGVGRRSRSHTHSNPDEPRQIGHPKKQEKKKFWKEKEGKQKGEKKKKGIVKSKAYQRAQFM